MIKKEKYWIEKILKFLGEFHSKSIRIQNLARSKFTRDNLKWIILLNRYSKMMKTMVDQNLKIPFTEIFIYNPVGWYPFRFISTKSQSPSYPYECSNVKPYLYSQIAYNHILHIINASLSPQRIQFYAKGFAYYQFVLTSHYVNHFSYEINSTLSI